MTDTNSPIFVKFDINTCQWRYLHLTVFKHSIINSTNNTNTNEVLDSQGPVKCM